MKAILRSINNFSCKLKQSNNLKYNISPKIRSNKFKNISGNGNIVIEDALNKNLKDYKIYGNTYQNSTSGKNLLDYIDTFVSSGGGLTNIINDDGSITTTGIPTSNYVAIIKQYDIIDELEDGQTYTISSETQNQYIYVQVNARKINGGTDYIYNGNSRAVQFTVDKSKYNKYDLKIQVGTMSAWGTNSRTITNKYQLKKGATATEFEPYTGGQPSPNPDYPQEIISCGDKTKNLFDKNNANNLLNNVSINNGTSVISNANGFYTLRIDCKPNTTYTISKVVSSRFIVAYSNNLTYTSGETLLGKVSNNSATNLTITTGENAKTLYVFYSHLSDETTYTLQEILDSIQIEEGSATSYEPYGYKIPVNVRSDNLFDVNWYFDNCVTHNCSKELIENSIKISFTAGADAYIGEARNSSVGTTPAIQNIAIAVKNNTQYTFIASSLPRCYITYMDKNYDILNSSYIRFDSSYTKSSYTFTTPENCKYVAFRMGIQNNEYTEWTFDDIQLVEGSTAPSKYIPYYNETTNIYLDEPLRKTKDDTYVDYIDFANQKVYRQLGEIQTTNYAQFNHNGNTERYTKFTSIVINNLKSNIPETAISNRLFFCNYTSTLDGTTPSSRIRFKILHELLGTTTSSTAQEAKQALINLMSGKTMEFVYPLETPTEEDIELPNINLIEGKNIITIGTEVYGVFETEYYSKEIIDISNYKYNLRKAED